MLSGQVDGELEDLERIYVDLENIDNNIDCLAFEGNVYTQGVTFDNFSSAYIRLVNADTNQEVARCSLGKGTTYCTDTFKSRVLLFAKLIRGKDRWILHTVSEPRQDELRRLPPGVQEEMLPPAASDDRSDGAPGAQEMDRWHLPATEGDLEVALESKTDWPQKQKARGKPQRSFLVPAVAVGTVAGIAAAVALFGPDPLDIGSMGSDIFSNGVDWGELVSPDIPTDCGCLHDCEICGGFNAGDIAGDGCDTCKNMASCEPCFDGLGLENPCPCAGLSSGDGCGDMQCFEACGGCGPIGEVANSFGSALDALGSSCANVLAIAGGSCGDGFDAGQDFIDGVCGPDVCDALVQCKGCDVAFLDCGVSVDGVTSACGAIASSIGDTAGVVCNGCGDCNPDPCLQAATGLCNTVTNLLRDCNLDGCIESSTECVRVVFGVVVSVLDG